MVEVSLIGHPYTTMAEPLSIEDLGLRIAELLRIGDWRLRNRSVIADS
jgi:hypothetical protein